MKLLFWIGMVVLILGLLALVVPIPQTERDGISAGGMSMEIETRHSTRLSPLVGGMLVLAGAGMMIAGRSGVRK
jgi:uncharacterized membrane protein